MNRERSRRFSPSVWECLQAEKVFSDTVQHYLPCCDMSRAAIIRNALASVWSAGRIYQAAAAQSNSTHCVALYEQLRKKARYG